MNKLIKRVFPNGRFHWQNLNDFADGSTGLPIEGRCWLNLDWNNSLFFSWNVKTDFCHIGLSLDKHGDEKVLFKVAFPPVALWFGANIKALDKVLERILPKDDYWGRNIGVSIHSGSIWWDIFAQEGYWSKDIPRWQDGNFNVFDFILGKMKYTNKVIEEANVDVPMPEGNYPANIKMEMATWKRPRWFANRVKRANIKMEKPIPFPGKGENSWDCCDDACYGSTMPANNVGDAIGKMVGSVLHDRLRRGGPYKWNR